MRKEIDPKIQAAARQYERALSEHTPLSHFIVIWREAGRTLARTECEENRARSWAYQSGGECFAVLPIDGDMGATLALLKPLSAAQWRARQLGGR